MKKEKSTQVYGWPVRFLRLCARAVLFDWNTSGVCTANGPVVYVVHHRNMFGPIHAMALLPDTAPLPRPWVLHVFLEKESCYRQFYRYTFTRRLGWPRPLAAATAWVLSRIVPGLLRACGAIPVYRELRRAPETMRRTQEALLRGESILLCPDIAYESDDMLTGEIYKGFFRLERTYCAATGEHLPFVPLCCARTKTLVTGETVFCTGASSWRAAREAAAHRMVEELNRLVRCAEEPHPTGMPERACGKEELQKQGNL